MTNETYRPPRFGVVSATPDSQYRFKSVDGTVQALRPQDEGYSGAGKEAVVPLVWVESDPGRT